MEYNLDFNNQTECLVFRNIPNELKRIYTGKHKIKNSILYLRNHLFYSFCDLISVDFSQVSIEIADLLYSTKNILPLDDGFPSDALLQILNKHSVLFCDFALIKLEMLPSDLMYEEGDFEKKLLISRIFKLLSPYILLKSYVERSIIDERFRDSEVFAVFSGRALETQISLARVDTTENIDYKSFVDFEYPECIDDVMSIFIDSVDTRADQINFWGKTEVECCANTFKELLSRSYTIKKCENCGKYFVPYNRSDTIYCDRPSPQDSAKTCKEYGTKNLWYDKLKEDKALKLYRNIYMAKQMLVKRNPDITAYKKSFEEYKKLSKVWKDEYKAGNKTEIEFIEWLTAMKEKKVL